MDFVESGDPFIFTEYFAGEAYHTPVLCIGIDPSDSNTRLCLTLNSQTRALLTAPPETVLAALLQKGSPMRRVKVNSGPSLTPLYDADGLQFELSETQLEELADDVRADTAVCQRLVDLVKSQAKAWPASTHVEQQIYEGFTSTDDEALLQRFHYVDWPERLALLVRLKDARLRTLGLRLIHGEAPHVLNPAQQLEVRAHLAQRMQGEGGPLCLDRAIAQTDALLAEHAKHDTSHLHEYRQYLESRISVAA